MKKRNPLIHMSVLASIFILFMSIPSHADEVRGVTDDMIKVGVIIDLTGPFADLTVPIKEAIVNYIKHVNSVGGIHGRKIKIIVEDDRYAIPPAIAAFKKLVFRDKIFATFGPSQTGASVALFSGIEKERVVTFPPNHSERLVAPHKRYIFMPGASYSDQINVIVDYIVQKSKKEKPRIAIVRFDLEYGKVGLAAAEKRSTFYNTQLVSDVIVAPGALEATSQVMTLRRAKANNVILHGNPSMAVSVLRDSRKLGYMAKFIGTLGCNSDAMVRMAGVAAKMYIGTHYFGTWYDNAPGIRGMKEVTLKYYPNTKPRNQGYTMGWSMAHIFTEGLRRAGKNLTSETFVNALETLKDFDTQGICGPVTFTSTSHKPNQYSKFFKADVENGRIVSFTDWLKPVGSNK